MDYSLELWKDQNQSEQSASANIPALLLEQQRRQSYGSGLALSVQESGIKSSDLSSFPDSSVTGCPRNGGLFSLSQWQELEVQLLIFKYMVAGVNVPMDLLILLQKSLPDKLAFNSHFYPQGPSYQPGAAQTGYWGRDVADTEPGRCRRTDGKKWRCSRDVVAGKKYCERHMHRGRNRSRKLMEDFTSNSNSVNNFQTTTSSVPSALPKCDTLISLSGPSSSSDLLELSQRSMADNSGQQVLYKDTFGTNSSGKVLRHFFEDSPRSCGNKTMTSTYSPPLSIFSPGNTSSEFSLKLSTDNVETVPSCGNIATGNARWSGWGNHLEAPTSSPLAEALRASALTSPTSVLLKPNRSVSETNSFSG
ncbi:growth-regulating factor 3-like [Aristolochia californica]|uniref:growth-regulating factor 3-like n=1 Tax=Aristolochia californica TaxID=171875 RepID=UPI0035D69567